ncbi:hypothetical protein I350_05783 [Cryptococcus amylolentus CBS 6273]|uniref:Zn(2)-C6 fungal-type domain-containing protein n=1 Tax=Cryptococcus amylolentus CBS 6273 TaxID=1296118 RepID=A0A1E3JPX2_9TREE|nr:hypothetical protein I350_05783 [Cryptococcus amylolentus CBS 6273]
MEQGNPVDFGIDDPVHQNREIRRACDACRKRKRKCDGPVRSHVNDSKCVHCSRYDLDCTYTDHVPTQKGPPKGYLEMVEQRCGRLEQLLKQAVPDIDLDEYVGPPIDPETFDIVDYKVHMASLSIPPYPAVKPLSQTPPYTATNPLPSDIPSPESEFPLDQVITNTKASSAPSDVADPEELVLVKHTSRLQVVDRQWRYHGKPSPVYLVLQLQELRRQLGLSNLFDEMNNSKRDRIWEIPQWEIDMAEEGMCPIEWAEWPEEGLDKLLINSYFDHVAVYVLLLNRVIFEGQYDRGLWRTNRAYAQVCLAVFACGAKFVSDPRVKMPDDTGGYHPYSAGWIYMRVLLRTGYNFLQSPSLYSLQKTVLICQFFQGSSTVPHTLPVISSLGLRSSEELGIHVRQLLHHVDPVERELYTRAFWCLYHIDRYNCTFVGRSVAMRDCDFDIEYPKDVDDEYWQLGFKQSEEKVSRVAVFIQTCKLDRIVGRIMQTFYTVESSSQPVVFLRRAADELSADLDVLTEELPSVLHWDNERGDYRIFQQAAALRTYFHYCKILIYRPFISSSGNHTKNDPLETCLSASYSISDILSACLHRGRRESCQPGHSLDISYILPVWCSGMIILASLLHKTHSTDEYEQALFHVKVILAASKDIEVVWRQCGKVTDFLTHLVKEAGEWRTMGGGEGMEGGEDDMRGTVRATLSSLFSPPPLDRRAQDRDSFGSWMRFRNFETHVMGMSSDRLEGQSSEANAGTFASGHL